MGVAWGAWSSWELPGLEGGTRRVLLTAGISPLGSHLQVLFPPQHQKSQVISTQGSQSQGGQGEDTTRVCGGVPNPILPSLQFPRPRCRPRRTIKGGLREAEPANGKANKQLSGTGTSRRGQCHLGRAQREGVLGSELCYPTGTSCVPPPHRASALGTTTASAWVEERFWVMESPGWALGSV